MKKLGNTEAEFKKSVAYKKTCTRIYKLPSLDKEVEAVRFRPRFRK